jgi:di/tricarboxylate transporter
MASTGRLRHEAPQFLAFGILGAMMALFIRSRLRYGLVAILSLLAAVGIGAAFDFLTTIGHQCNTLVMGPGGYKFSDYARLGAPLSLIVVLVGIPLILLFWPLK